MIASTTVFLALALGAFSAPSSLTGFEDLSVRTIQLNTDSIEKLPIAVIEGLRFADPLPRPLTAESLDATRASFANVTALTGTTITDEVIEELQGRYSRKLWGPGYVDITEGEARSTLEAREGSFAVPYPTPNPSAHPELTAMLAKVSGAELKSIVTQLSTAYATRYYRSTNAAAPAQWIQSQFASWLGAGQSKTVANSFAQPNVIGRIEAKAGSTSKDIIILGAHLDSTSQTPTTKAPGADDDASGVAAVMSIMRILKESNFQGNYAIEAHAYAGEEGGLLGATALAKSYKSSGVTVRGMLDFEMIGYQPSTSTNSGKSSTISILSDPNADMSAHMTSVVAAYVPTAERRSVACGYGCSDHYAFSDQGYPVVCIAAYGPNDRNLNPNYHTTNDVASALDFNKAADFVKAGLAWVVEVS